MFFFLLLLLSGTSTAPPTLPPIPVTGTDPFGKPDVRTLVVHASPHPTTLEFYNRLPQYHRTLDTSGELLKFLALIGDQMGAGDDLLDRIIPGEWPSDLTNPWAADARWLAWLAQLAGVDLSGTSDTESQRYLIANAATGHRAGTTTSIQSAVIPFLSGNRRLNITRNTAGDSWHVTISVYGPELGFNEAPLRVALESVRPAGVEFTLDIQAGISIDQLVGTIDDLGTTYPDALTIDDFVRIPPP